MQTSKQQNDILQLNKLQVQKKQQQQTLATLTKSFRFLGEKCIDNN